MAKRNLGFKKYVLSLNEGLSTACMLLMLIAGSTILGHFITRTNIPQMTANWIVALPLNRYVIMFLICLVYELGGSFIDDLAFMVLATPIFYPAVLKLGFDPIWFGVVYCMNMHIAYLSPPFAPSAFYMKSITPPHITMGQIYLATMPYLWLTAVATVIVTVWPSLSIWLPRLLLRH